MHLVGDPDPAHITTNHVERQNLNIRMGCRRFTRETNASSRKLRNHRAAVALYVAHSNFCRVHEALRITPAMALVVTDHIWSIAELIDAALSIAPEEPAAEEPAPAPRAPLFGTRSVESTC